MKTEYPCLLKKKVSDLTPADYNPRTITDEAIGRLTKSLAELGNLQPITWNVRTGRIVGGHQRLKCYQAMGKKEVEVWAVDLSEDKEKAANLALNKLAGEFDPLRLKDLVEQLDTGGLDLEITGFSLDELADMMSMAPPEITEDKVPEPPANPITKPGDLWLLGDHRLLCGDSTKADQVRHLIGSGKADMVLSDPPYGVSYVGKTKDALKVENDELDEAALAELVCKAFDNAEANCRPGAYWYATVPPGPLHILFADDWKRRGILRQIMVWAKDSMVLGHSEYHYQHEPILFGWVPGERHKNSDRTRTTLWQCDRPKANREHPTMKPVALWARAVADGSRDGEIVYDPFLGSGTTLIASEQLGRRCYGMEISPAYCDVIVKRWENLTGRKSELCKS